MLEGKRFTTVNTDAGIKGNIAAYAYWIRSNEAVYVRSGKFKKPKSNSNEAELAAILIALHFVSSDEYLRSADVVVVNCDNKTALELLRNNRLETNSEYFLYYKEVRDKISAPIYFKWVKGHSKGKTSREWVNNFIDKSIRKHYKN